VDSSSDPIAAIVSGPEAIAIEARDCDLLYSITGAQEWNDRRGE